MKQQTEHRRARPPRRWSRSCCRCSTPSTPALAHGADESSSRSPARCSTSSRRRASSASTRRASRSTPTEHEAVAHEPRRRRRARSSPRCCAPATAGRAACCGPPWCKVTGLRERPMAPQREWFEKDYYKVLGVSETATEKEITQRLPEAGQGAPPRRQPGRRRRGAVQGGLRRLRRARRRRRSARSTTRSAGSGPVGGGFGGGGAGGGGFGGFNVDDLGDLGDLLRRPVQPRPRPAAAGAAAPGPQRGADLEAELHLSFDDAVTASPPRVNLTSDAACSTCHGTGAAPGTAPRHLPDVRRPRRASTTTRACSRFSQPCRDCGGRGHASIETPCPTCRGTGVERRPAAGEGAHPRRASTTASASGSRAGAAPGRNGGPPGDLYVVVRVGAAPAVRPQGRRPHPHRADHLPRGRARRRRHGADARRQPGHAADPARHPVGPHVPGQGPGRAHAPRAPGDLLVTVEVAVPAEAVRRRAQGASRRWPRRPTESPASAPGGVSRWPTTTDADRAVYVISVAAELAGVHPQTLRIYERKGLRRPGPHRRRQPPLQRGRHRRGCAASRSSPPRASTWPACKRVLELEAELARLRDELDAAAAAGADEAVEQTHRQYRRDLVPAAARPLVPSYRPRPRGGVADGARPEPLDASRPRRRSTPPSTPATAEQQPRGHPRPPARRPARPGGGRRPARSSRRSARPRWRCATPADERRRPSCRRPTAARPGWAATSSAVLDAGRRARAPSCATSTCRPSTCCSPWPTASASSREELLAALQEVRGSHRVTSQNPEEQYQALEKYGRDLTEAARAGQARPGHRPRRGDPPRHPGAVAPHQEQPGAHRRARRRQDRHRRGPGPPHRRGRRARGPEGQAPHQPRPRLDGRRRQVPRRVRGAAEGRPQGDHRRRGRGHHLHRRAAHRSSAPARPRARWTPATCSSRCSPAASCA